MEGQIYNPDDHAHWEKTAGGEYFCSKCGCLAAMNRNLMHVFKDPYCRHCGCKMDEEVVADD